MPVRRSRPEAIDYLLKPVTEARLQKSVERAASLLNRPVEIANQVASIASVATPEHPTRIRKVVGRSRSDYGLLGCSLDVSSPPRRGSLGASNFGVISSTATICRRTSSSR